MASLIRRSGTIFGDFKKVYDYMANIGKNEKY
jgi:hypothetical protein